MTFLTELALTVLIFRAEFVLTVLMLLTELTFTVLLCRAEFVLIVLMLLTELALTVLVFRTKLVLTVHPFIFLRFLATFWLLSPIYPYPPIHPFFY